MTDPTLLPPPSYTKERADQIYGEAFRRAMEFVTLQKIPGDVLEFGTLNGYTARILAELMAELDHPGKLYLFDSFEGMPEATSEVDKASYEVTAGAWQPGTPRGRVENVMPKIDRAIEPIIPGRLVLVRGWYEETVGHIPEAPASIVHIDCDLYESTKTVLGALCARAQQGMIVLFDDWNSGRASKMLGERCAAVRAEIRLEPWFSYGWHGQAFIVHA